MWKYEGPKAFYRGMLPTLLQIGPLSGFQFGFYHFFLNLWGFLLKDETNTASAYNICKLPPTLLSLVVVPIELLLKVPFQPEKTRSVFISGRLCYVLNFKNFVVI